MTQIDRFSPKLVVEDASAAIAFYTTALGAEERERHDHGGRIVHAELELGGSVLIVKDADDVDPAPTQLGGTPVILTLRVTDVDAVAARMTDAGASVIFPVGDQDYGYRDGRFRDPYGHVWLLSQPLS